MKPLDLASVPLSRFGSYISFSLMSEGKPAGGDGGAPALWLRTIQGEAPTREVFRLELLAGGAPVPFTAEADASELRLKSDAGTVRLCIASDEVVRLRGEGVGLRLSLRSGGWNSAVPLGGGAWRMNATSARLDYTVLALAGRLDVDAPWARHGCVRSVADFLPGADGVMEGAVVAMQSAKTVPTALPSYRQAQAGAAEDFRRFRQFYPTPGGDLGDAADLAAYINWASVVSARGQLRRPAMYMSKNWMCNVWSWDHCFNAMALAAQAPELAWDQFMVMFDHQTPEGQIPDYMNDVGMIFSFVKPPVHGWTYRRLLAANPFFAERDRLREAYEKLKRWTDWWFGFRNPDGDGLPVYHHGNDSGWDNATVFDVGLPLKSADLAAFLVEQMDVLAEMAGRLGLDTERAEWQQRGGRTLAALLEKLWTDDRFVCRHALTGAVTEKSDCSLPCTPILLGMRLPAPVRHALVRQIRHFLTEWGVASEHPQSPLYQADGYWRGPIWAPPTLILVEGLRRSGETALAADIARRFCNLCRKSGFAENYDAVSGAPLRDRAYTWTASAFLELLRTEPR